MRVERGESCAATPGDGVQKRQWTRRSVKIIGSVYSAALVDRFLNFVSFFDL